MIIQYKKVNLDMLDEIQKLNYKVFLGVYENDPYPIEVYHQRLNGKQAAIFAAYDKNTMVGAAITYDEGDSLYIWTLAVDQNYRGRGIGKRLISMCEKYALDNKIPKISSKVYAVSEAMNQILKFMHYETTKIECSAKDAKWDCTYYEKTVGP